MKTIIIGLPYYAKNIADNLSAVDPLNSYIPLDTSGNSKDKLRFLAHLPAVDAVYLISANIARGGALTAAMAMKKRIVMHWVGSDVLVAGDAHHRNEIDWDLIRYSHHLVETPWLQDELTGIGIAAEIAPIFCLENDLQAPPPLPKRFSILSRIGKGRESFYGIDHLIKLAQDFPDIDIKLVGLSESSHSLPANMRMLGWVGDMASEYAKSVLCLRLPKHDGLSYFVLEAMGYGRHVGFSYKCEGSKHVTSYSDLKEFVVELRSLHDNGALGVNQVGHDFVRSNFKKSDVMGSLRRQILGR